MIIRLIEVFSSDNDEFICCFNLESFWNSENLRTIVDINSNDPEIYDMYRLDDSQVTLLGGEHLLRLNNGKVECFLSYISE